MTGGHRCIQCGESYLFTRVYKGNYCPNCHRQWTERRPNEDRSRRRVRFGRRSPEARNVPDETSDEQYDEE